MKNFENPIIEIEKFEVADIITTLSLNPEDQWATGVEKIN